MDNMRELKPAKPWWAGSPAVEPFMPPVAAAISRHIERKDPAWTDIYNRAYEAVYEAMNRRAQPENEPLTLDEMNALDHEPIYVLHTGGKWTMNGWHIATASSYQNHGRCDLEIDNGNTKIDMQNYGKTWLAYRRKPERSELDA